MINCEFEDGYKANNLRHVVVDTIVTNDKNQVLLVKRAEHLSKGAGLWAIPGGFVDRDELIIEAARREVLEETGYKVTTIERVAVVDDPERGDDRQNIAFVHVAVAGERTQEPDDESEEVRWFDKNNLPPKENIAFDHFELLALYLK